MREIWGGNAEQVPKPWKLMFPGRCKRTVKVTLSIYSRHYWVDISEEDNRVWDAQEQAWCIFRDHPDELRGWCTHKKFGSAYSAKVFIEEQLKRFPTKTHKVRWDYGKAYVTKRWLAREGD